MPGSITKTIRFILGHVNAFATLSSEGQEEFYNYLSESAEIKRRIYSYIMFKGGNFKIANFGFPRKWFPFSVL